MRTPKLSLVFTKNLRHRQRFAVVVSKKISKSAVGRNRIRRRIYEAIRLELPQYPEKNDCIFVVYSADCATLPFPQLRAIVHGLLHESMV